MDPRLVIFDMDGTVLDTLEDLRGALNYALERHGHGSRTLEQMRAYVGSGLYAMVTSALGNCEDKAVCDPVFGDFRSYYLEHYNVKTRPYPGIVELLGKLKARGIKCAISSNKVDSAANELTKAHFGDLVDMCVGESPETPRKPDLAGTFRLMRTLGASPADTLYVGDSDVDCLTAKNAGLPFIAVTWGFRSRTQLEAAGAKVFADDCAELEKLLIS